LRVRRHLLPVVLLILLSACASAEAVTVTSPPKPSAPMSHPATRMGEVEAAAGEQAAIDRFLAEETARQTARAAADQARAVKARQPAPAPRSAPPTPAAGKWDRVAACESHGNWVTATGNGYEGGLQMDAEFWRTYDGAEFAARPSQASRDQQIVVAERARDGYAGHPARGYSPWPTCGSR
jgi:hypothetical protein